MFSRKYTIFYISLFSAFTACAGVPGIRTVLNMAPSKAPNSAKSERNLRKIRADKKRAYRTIKNMSLEELHAKKNELLTFPEFLTAPSQLYGSAKKRQKCKEHTHTRMINANKERAIKYTERMITLCTDLDQRGNLMLEAADLNFDCGHLDPARTLYKEFITLYPGNEKAEYAAHKELLCAFYMSLDVDRDQTKTEEAIEAANKFLERSDLYTTYNDQVRSIKQACEKKLIDSQLQIASFYEKQGNYKSAQTRLELVKNDFKDEITQFPHAQTIIAQLEKEITQHIPRQAAPIVEQNTIVAQLKAPEQDAAS